jgi:hypothetical protein
MSNSTIREELVDMTCNAEMLFADGLDDAITGYTTKGCAVYSIDAIIDILVSEGMTEEDAFDHFYYNIDGSYVGEFTPIYINTI